mgnify:CR=1 FL=1
MVAPFQYRHLLKRVVNCSNLSTSWDTVSGKSICLYFLPMMLVAIWAMLTMLVASCDKDACLSRMLVLAKKNSTAGQECCWNEENNVVLVVWWSIISEAEHKCWCRWLEMTRNKDADACWCWPTMIMLNNYQWSVVQQCWIILLLFAGDWWQWCMLADCQQCWPMQKK